MIHDLKVLLLEDDPDDARIICDHLIQGKLECRIHTVDSCLELERRLSRELPDVVLSDYVLPDGDGIAALRCVRSYSSAIPFIFVADAMGEERAVDSLQKGATDFLLKTNLHLLAPAVRRALRESVEQVQRIEAETQFHEFSSSLQKLLEGERTRIARTVHDELGQSLAALKFDLVGISAQLPEGLPELKNKLRHMLQDADHMILVARKIISELRPGILDDLGIVAALEWQAADFEKRTKIVCRVTTTLEDAVRRPELDTVIFRIFQGLLANILQHADATEVSIHSTEEDGEWVLVVEDNGKGILIEDSQKKLSFGILGMRELASEFGGTITYKPVDPHGTKVTLNLPLPSTLLVMGGGA